MKDSIYTDGGYSMKREVGAAAIYFPKSKEYDWSGPWTESTTQRMEIMGLRLAIEDVMRDPREVIIYTDSKYCEGVINEWWRNWVRKGLVRTKSNHDLWLEFFKRYKTVSHLIKVKWIKGHSGIKGNEAADKMCTKVYNSGKRPQIDKGVKHRWNSANTKKTYLDQ